MIPVAALGPSPALPPADGDLPLCGLGGQMEGRNDLIDPCLVCCLSLHHPVHALCLSPEMAERYLMHGRDLTQPALSEVPAPDSLGFLHDQVAFYEALPCQVTQEPPGRGGGQRFSIETRQYRRQFLCRHLRGSRKLCQRFLLTRREHLGAGCE